MAQGMSTVREKDARQVRYDVWRNRLGKWMGLNKKGEPKDSPVLLKTVPVKQEDYIMLEITIKCPICRRPYKVYSHYAGDQSACPACRREADEAVRRADTLEQIKRRSDYWK
jgi:hypothetical protein